MEKLSTFLEDLRFIEWIVQPTPELQGFWNDHLRNHPEDRENIEAAKRLVSRLRIREIPLDEKEKIMLFSRIIKHIEHQGNRRKRLALVSGMLRYAAVAIIFFALGYLLFHQKESIDPRFFTEEYAVPSNGGSAKLIRSTGEDIILEQDKSLITYSPDGQLQINQVPIDKASDRSNTKAGSLNQLVIPYGKSSQVMLSDGTIVHLNAGSRLVYPEVFHGSTREVILSGEAFFEVSPDAERPFFVYTNDLRIRVLGTKFNVSAYPLDNVVETVLAEGRISLGRNDENRNVKSYELKPGDLASFNRTSGETVLRQVDLDNYILWTQGILKFESTHLSRVLKRLERYYDIRFNIQDALLGTMQISGKLVLTDDPGETIERIARTASVTIEKSNENYYMVRK